ncbi:JAB domain-containing protein [Paraflavitalea pollutisoli]|uniref:JAB domain-containing protein n=1 Tax=Paraflavitalea pollutisoli TaxID=3034143 RepID=UPI0023ED9EE3|nr:JAB domain-containing protein [Paraflavitalea sp. H1-2-19X]
MEHTVVDINLQNVAEIEFTYRNKIPASKRPTLTTSRDSYKIFLGHWNMDRIQFIEEIKILLLNASRKVLGIVHLGTGGISATVVDLRIIYGIALKTCACQIILCHNHPSGGLTPSMSDQKITRKLKEAGELLDINFLDHLIISDTEYYSFADEGLL